MFIAHSAIFGIYVPPHPHLAAAAALLLYGQLIDVWLTILVLGTFCSASEGLGGCMASLFLMPLAGVVAPIYGLFATLHVLLVTVRIPTPALILTLILILTLMPTLTFTPTFALTLTLTP